MNPPSVEMRSFHYSDNKSDKFWMILLEDNQHTVRYGRTGTQGQQQTKEFPTAEKARQSYEKLIREKMAKGYVETEEIHSTVNPVTKPTVEQAAEFHSPAVSLTTPEVKEPATIDPSLQPDRPVRSEPLNKTIDLNPEDWFLATWRKLPPLQRPTPKPFDLQDCLARFRKVTVNYNHWNWSKAAIEPVLSREEAHFWLTAIAEPKSYLNEDSWNVNLKPKDLVEKLSHYSFDGNISPEQLNCLPLLSWYGSHVAETFPTIYPLLNLLSVDDFIESAYHRRQASPFLFGFRSYILPYLTQAEIERLRSHFRPRLDPKQWLAQQAYGEYSLDYYFAACLGFHDELLTVVESWSDDTFNNPNQPALVFHQRPQELIFGLGDPHLVEHHMRRLGLKLQPPQFVAQISAYIRNWLAHTEFSALALIRDTVLGASTKEDAEELLQAFTLVKAPEAAPFMLELMLSSKAPQVARQWIEENPEHAIAGLIPVAAGRGKLADSAIDFLRAIKRRGYTVYIQTCIAHELPEVAEKVRASVLNVEEKEYISLNEKTTPQWLQESLAALSIKSAKKANWSISPVDLPPIAIGDHRLNDSQIEAILNALRQSKLDSPDAFVVAVKAHADRSTLDTFAWKLFEFWLTEGAPSKENWAMMAVGLLGSDTSALKLAPLIRVWPGESQHHRAVLGLECLRAIGSDTALMQINGIAQKVKFKGIKQRAQECMEAIAQERGMTREQLEDRIVPDCDLDEHGSRIFDFGARQFRFVLGADLKPMVKDTDGKVKSDLPKLNTKDDKEKAEEAIANWKLLKKQVSEVIKIQSPRLEQAMVTGRHWQANEFELLLVNHPLMTHLTQRLIWGCYDAAGTLITTFRVTEDRTYADCHDETFNLSNEAMEQQGIGIVHPLHLTPDVGSTWGELLSDYEIVQPFLQLGRPLHSLEPGEETALEITRFKGREIPIVALVRTLENLGWQRGVLHDHGDYSLHFKYFSAADITVVVGEYQEVFVDLSVVVSSGVEDIDRCCFLRGLHNHLYDYPIQSWKQDLNGQLIPLGEVNPVIISEVLKDLITVVAKAQ